ncbi:MAG: HEPN domain-containing protein [Candidatus Eremiobacteraeota bacterium]|nr:HEPN domain-containing protein [Candidatus Eremiobacteraeota bacterium]
MTEENKKLNVQFEWERAGESIRAAEVLLSQDLWADTVSKAYYGMFHLARALLFSLGMEAKTHGGMVHLMSMHLVRTGELPSSMVQDFSLMQKRREDADYQVAMRFERSNALEARELLLRFRKETETFLRLKGYL